MKKKSSQKSVRLAPRKQVQSSSKEASELTSAPKTTSLFRRILTWLGWGLLYIVVFYLGNLSGEYVAAHMPILPSLPRISVDMDKFKNMVPKVSLPKISVAWKWPVKTSAPVPDATHTTLVIVRGNFINMPTEGATDTEKKAYVDSVDALTIEANKISINDACELSPAFVRVKQGTALMIASTAAKDHTLMIESKSVTIASKQNTSISLTQSEGAYPISCDGVIAGFYRIN
jgi:plastocyanin